MEKGRKELLKKVPTRKLLASIKRDMRKLAGASKPKPKEVVGVHEQITS